jgi:hypothetical protein
MQLLLTVRCDSPTNSNICVDAVAPQTTFDVPQGDVDKQQLLKTVQQFVQTR